MTQTLSLEEQADRAAAAGELATARALLEQAVAADGSNFGQWLKLSAMRKASGDLKGALIAVDRALALSPLDFASLLARAAILDQMGDPMAGREFGHALAQLPPGEDVSGPWQAPVAHARKRAREYQQTLEALLTASLPVDLGPAVRGRMQRFISNRSRRTRHFHQEPSDFHYPGLPEMEIHDRILFPELDELERQTDVIRGEFEALIAAELAEIVPYTQYPDRVPLRQWKELNNNPRWSAIHLIQNGRTIAENARHCPLTMAALAKLPQPHVRGASPNAMFSLLAPRTRIPRHTGVANTRLVCHLPLIVPAGCGFQVGETTREWQVGEAFVFDDTIEHEAWNDSDQLRVVLIFDLWPPALSRSEREAVAAVVGSIGVSFAGG